MTPGKPTTRAKPLRIALAPMAGFLLAWSVHPALGLDPHQDCDELCPGPMAAKVRSGASAGDVAADSFAPVLAPRVADGNRIAGHMIDSSPAIPASRAGLGSRAQENPEETTVAEVREGFASSGPMVRVIREDPCPEELEGSTDRDLERRPDDTHLLMQKTICRIHRGPDYGLSWWDRAYLSDSAYSLYRLARHMREHGYDDDEILAEIREDVVEAYEAVRGSAGGISDGFPTQDRRWREIVPRAAFWMADWYAGRFFNLIWGEEHYRHMTPPHREGKRPYEPAKALEQALRHADTCMSAPVSAFVDSGEHGFYTGMCGKRRNALLEIREMERERLAAAAWCRSRDKELNACVVHDRVMVRMEDRQRELKLELDAAQRFYLRVGAGGVPEALASDHDRRPAEPAASAASSEPGGLRAWLTAVFPSTVRKEFESAYETWKAQDIADYRMWIERICLCRVAVRGPFIVEVRGGKPVQVVYAADGGPVPARDYGDLTVDAVFEYLGQAIEAIDRGGEVMGEVMKTDYHPVLGYPLWTGVISQEVMDSDINYVVHGLLAVGR